MLDAVQRFEQVALAGLEAFEELLDLEDCLGRLHGAPVAGHLEANIRRARIWVKEAEEAKTKTKAKTKSEFLLLRVLCL